MTAETQDLWMLQLQRAAIVRAEIRLAGMLAENEQRRVSGFSPAYVQSDFDAIISDEGIGYNDVIGDFQRSQ
jgi:hypothetical protein